MDVGCRVWTKKAAELGVLNSAECRNLDGNLASQVPVNIYLLRYFIPHNYTFKCTGGLWYVGLHLYSCVVPCKCSGCLALAQSLEPDYLPGFEIGVWLLLAM